MIRRLFRTLTRRKCSLHFIPLIHTLQNSGGADNAVKVWRLNTGESMYALLGGSLQNRGNNQPHPTRPGCSQVSFDETKVIASFSSLLRVRFYASLLYQQ